MQRRKTGFWATGTALGLGLMLAGCVPKVDEVPGSRLFADNCVLCHGLAGRGDGPAARGMDPAPADLSVLAMGNGGVFPRVAVMSQIDGYSRDGHSGMPAFGESLVGTELVQVDTGRGILTPTPVALVELADYIETLQRY